MHSSIALTPIDRRYSQLEKECLAIMYSCEHNGLYLSGLPFTMFTDHKLIMAMLNNPKAKAPLRIERMTLRSQGYTLHLHHIKEDYNISDYLTRHPAKPLETHNLETDINFAADYACPNALILKEILKKLFPTTNDDLTLNDI